MDNNTTTYKAMYEGEIIVPAGSYGNPSPEPIVESDPTYWYGDISVRIETTHKNAKDKPTLTFMIPASLMGITDFSVAAADFCLRRIAPYIDKLNEGIFNRARPDKENGAYYLYKPGGEVVLRNTAYFTVCPQKDYENGGGAKIYLLNDGVERPPVMCLCVMLQVQLPERKLRKTIQMLCRDLPDAMERFTYEFDLALFEKAMALANKQREIRLWLKDSPYCAFIADGSILPRSKGTELPMENAVPFASPPNDLIEVCGVRGMGIKRGVTVITGGGYSGKSTLLDAVSAGIYDHVYGDGRELCITDESALTVSAEDGRCIRHVNISPFIKWLPGGDTTDFSTQRASGSTSQAANIMEALEMGSRLLLIDEDRSATNFMIRDGMMKALISKEPITPFTDRVRQLYKEKGVSTLLVIGGSGEYLSVADKIYMMEDYIIHDVTEKAREISTPHTENEETTADWTQSRTLLSRGFTSYPERNGTELLAVSDMGIIFMGNERIDLRGLHNIISIGQMDALGFMLRRIAVTNDSPYIDIDAVIDEMYYLIGKEGLDSVYTSFFTTCRRFLDLPRKQELKGVINRMRETDYKKE